MVVRDTTRGNGSRGRSGANSDRARSVHPRSVFRVAGVFRPKGDSEMFDQFGLGTRPNGGSRT